MYITNCSGTFGGGQVDSEHFFLVEANSKEEAHNKTWKYVGLMSPFLTVDQVWSVALNVNSYPPLDALNSSLSKAYYMCEMDGRAEIGG